VAKLYCEETQKWITGTEVRINRRAIVANVLRYVWREREDDPAYLVLASLIAEEAEEREFFDYVYLYFFD